MPQQPGVTGHLRKATNMKHQNMGHGCWKPRGNTVNARNRRKLFWRKTVIYVLRKIWKDNCIYETEWDILTSQKFSVFPHFLHSSHSWTACTCPAPTPGNSTSVQSLFQVEKNNNVGTVFSLPFLLPSISNPSTKPDLRGSTVQTDPESSYFHHLNLPLCCRHPISLLVALSPHYWSLHSSPGTSGLFSTWAITAPAILWNALQVLILFSSKPSHRSALDDSLHSCTLPPLLQIPLPHTGLPWIPCRATKLSPPLHSGHCSKATSLERPARTTHLKWQVPFL